MMERKKVSVEFNRDEVALLEASLVKMIRQSGGNKTLEFFYPKADIDYLFKQLKEMKERM